MCLIVQDLKYRVANEDIVCYKIVKVHNHQYVSPCMKTRFFKRRMNVSDRFHEHPVYDEEGTYYVEHGIHSYASFRSAFCILNSMMSCIYCEDYRILKCTIPKGTKYYTGAQNTSGFENYCSEKLKYDRISL